MSRQESRREPKARRRPAPKAGGISLVHQAPAAQREALIATAAYFRAQKRGFEPGHELDDWLAAEVEIASLPITTRVGGVS
jgi:hypothetical protein